ncbi:MAG: hypothetical protein ACUVSF_05040 [Anaerolineae bacterium]
MPKKTRRSRSHPLKTRTGPSSSVVTHAQVAQPEVAPRVAAPSTMTNSGKRVDFSAEYHYIIGDLRKMAIIAASMFVVLIALSFLIR